MSRLQFDGFFQKATGNSPYAYQSRLAGSDSGTTCNSQLINIPTGLGKTAAVVLAWLWNRVQLQNPKWPRRLVYCLPMRTLVEQTEREVRTWILRLARKHTKPRDGSELRWLALHSPIILMGGEDTGDWDIHPERPAILIGTQDMLLSRALNRGYGMSRYRWPMHFGLLNNDCMWVLDETQLMGVGVETSAQLDGFRNLAQWANDQNCRTWWMSATMDEDRFATVDHPKPAGGWDKIKLSDTERAADRVRERFEAKKPVAKAGLVLNADTKKACAVQLANLIGEKHQSGSLTLVVVNRVARAREIYAALKKLKSNSLNPDHIALIHSRFRPTDRTRHTKLLFGDGDRIVIATQAVEAGVDVSARLLITELAPWSSLVQRFGRCNREGKIPDAEAIWIDIQPKDDKDDLILPYSFDDLKKAGEELQKLRDTGPKSLSSVHVPETPVIRPVLRRRDLIDLFDTTPDLCGQDLDVSRYIRDGEDSDVQFFWRTIPEKSEPTSDEKPPRREELCRVSIGEAQKFIDKQPKPHRAWQWNSLEEVWQRIERVRPGAVYLIDVASGGYDDDLGWTGEPKNKPTPFPPADGDTEFYRKDPQTFARYWLPLDEHTQNVVVKMTKLAEALSLDNAMTAIFNTAALWHDIGKAHKDFQRALRYGKYQPEKGDMLYAKSKNPYHPKAMVKERRGFRHELASALAWLSAGPADATERDLIAFLIAAHHGKVRLSIRALPDEKGNPANPDGLYARGIWHDDKLPAVSDTVAQPVTLDLRLMQMGDGDEHGPSWLARMIGLRDGLGPFRLAYLETLLRAADMRASREESERLSEADGSVRNQHAEKPKET
jgi:CRISPR-associated endonuclease/helicase Cas3